jgi:hypothetical protein
MPSLRIATPIAACGFAILLAAPGLAPVYAQTNRTSQQLVLVDPTPRERDPHAVFGDNQTDRANQQDAASLQRAQRRDQVVAETDQLLLLAQQLRDSIAKSSSGPAVPDIMTAQKIEKLAKSVKDQMKMQ